MVNLVIQGDSQCSYWFPWHFLQQRKTNHVYKTKNLDRVDLFARPNGNKNCNTSGHL